MVSKQDQDEKEEEEKKVEGRTKTAGLGREEYRMQRSARPSQR